MGGCSRSLRGHTARGGRRGTGSDQGQPRPVEGQAALLGALRRNPALRRVQPHHGQPQREGDLGHPLPPLLLLPQPPQARRRRVHAPEEPPSTGHRGAGLGSHLGAVERPGAPTRRTGRDDRGRTHRYARDPEAEALAWLDKIAALDSKRSRYQDMAAEGHITFDELGAKLRELEGQRTTAEEELDSLQMRRARLEDLERDRETLLKEYAGMVPEALDGLTGEERHQVYRMLRLQVF